MRQTHLFPASVLLAALLLAGCAHAPATSEATAAPESNVDAAADPATVEAPPAAADAVADSAVANAADVEGAVEPAAASEPDVASAPVDAGDAVAGNADATDPRTDAEREYDALYGDPDAITDQGLPAPAELEQSYDPWEGFNRRMHSFNNVVDRVIAKPLAKFYIAVTPRPVRLGVGNFFNNLGQPVSVLNSLLQGKPKQAAQALGRFALNSTLGIGGIFDPASDAKLPNRSEDFGQTLGVWGWKKSRYIELPLFGPRTVRDVFGMVGDSPLAPLRGLEEDKVRVFLQGLQLVDVRTQLMAVDSMREGATDEYALWRDAWMQRRAYQIFGDRHLQADDNLPDYLQEENNPTVPIDAIPVTPLDP